MMICLIQSPYHYLNPNDCVNDQTDIHVILKPKVYCNDLKQSLNDLIGRLIITCANFMATSDCYDSE